MELPGQAGGGAVQLHRLPPGPAQEVLGQLPLGAAGDEALDLLIEKPDPPGEVADVAAGRRRAAIQIMI